MLNDDTTSEQYADWAYYLNEFSDANKPLYKFYSADVAFSKRLSENNLNITDSYAQKNDASSFSTRVSW